MLPLSSRRSSTSLMSNLSYFASRTPSATFSKSQNSAMLTVSLDDAMNISIEAIVEFDDRDHDSDSSGGDQLLCFRRTDTSSKKPPGARTFLAMRGVAVCTLNSEEIEARLCEISRPGRADAQAPGAALPRYMSR